MDPLQSSNALPQLELSKPIDKAMDNRYKICLANIWSNTEYLVSEEQLAKLKKIADMGHPHALLRMTIYYEKPSELGYPVKAASPNSELAVHCYQRCIGYFDSEDGFFSFPDAETSFLLGVCYHTGYGVKGDRQKALKYYERASDKNHPESTFMLCKYFDYDLSFPLWFKAFGMPDIYKNKNPVEYHIDVAYKGGFRAVGQIRIAKKEAEKRNQEFLIAFNEPLRKRMEEEKEQKRQARLRQEEYDRNHPEEVEQRRRHEELMAEQRKQTEAIERMEANARWAVRQMPFPGY